MFKKKHRLAKTKDVQQVFARGRGFFYPLLNIKFARNSKMQTRFTVVVSTKVAKQAVRRNRLKRVTREFVRERLGQFPSGDYIITMKPAAGKVLAPELRKALAAAFTHAKLLSQ